MKITLSKSQWEFIGKKAGWGANWNESKFSKTPVEPTHQKELYAIVNKYEALIDINEFMEYKKKWGITTGEIHDEIEKKFPRNTNRDLYYKFESPTGLESANSVLVARIWKKMDDINENKIKSIM